MSGKNRRTCTPLHQPSSIIQQLFWLFPLPPPPPRKLGRKGACLESRTKRREDAADFPHQSGQSLSSSRKKGEEASGPEEEETANEIAATGHPTGPKEESKTATRGMDGGRRHTFAQGRAKHG